MKADWSTPTSAAAIEVRICCVEPDLLIVRRQDGKGLKVTHEPVEATRRSAGGEEGSW